MQAVILAGGLGTRLWPLTATVPKPMTPAAGKPYLAWQLEELSRQSIRDILLLTGYLGEQIEDYFGDGDSLGLRIRYSREAQPMGTGGALRDARAGLDSTFLLIYGDSYLPISYQQPMLALESSGTLAVMVVTDNRVTPSGVPGNVAINEAGMVEKYEKDGAHCDFVDAGVLVLRPEVLDAMPPNGVVSLERDVFPQLAERRRLKAFVTAQRFFDIGTPERLETIERYFSSL
jgi:NDP-sugar pyrophosphorylase family protein